MNYRSQYDLAFAKAESYKTFHYYKFRILFQESIAYFRRLLNK
ncbi:hypothetical protein [Nonlabens dokdonensis]|nr:hypothetical protein [Nonlabens dokdonensis]